ncbi:single-stranded DNA-binding protein [Listeria booriae]|uniref:single-stranded DNA-binding protein n=1 Tax=Listeria booriae TaxID=1552123 RepID=UPI0016270106|nr:single-stranded DNA-binding protein [Listeria booriae]MBC2368122.1 single-stranded DNA-binding protein [Listeria booriae]
MMNRVVLVGRLTKDPELRYTPAGVAVATFTLAVNRNFTNQNGEREVDYINCVVWRKLAENTANFLKKGSLAGVDGKVQTRNYEGNDGKRVYVTEILCESVQFLEPRRTQEGGQVPQNNNQSNYNQTHQNRNQTPYTANNDPFANHGKPIDISDDDLPF